MAATKFTVNDVVFVKSYGQQGRIEKLVPMKDGTQYYSVELGKSWPVTLREDDLTRILAPLERLANGEYGDCVEFDLVVRAMALDFAYRYEGWSCLSNARLDPKPYQVFVAHRVLQDLYPRFILADEVGLGKTIEAGLILKELKARGLANRILIVTPASLREQWKGELDAKFNERFHIYDATTIEENQKRNPRRHPWAVDDHVIVSKDFARGQVSDDKEDRNKGRAIDEVEWDLVVFDEAHHLRRKLSGQKIEATKLYGLGQKLAENARSLLLLTATPMQLSTYEAYSLIELVNSSLFDSYEQFEMLRKNQSGERWRSIMDAIIFLRDATKAEIEELPDTLCKLVGDLDSIGLAEAFWKQLSDSCMRVASDPDPSTVKADVECLRNYTEATKELPDEVEKLRAEIEIVNRHTPEAERENEVRRLVTRREESVGEPHSRLRASTVTILDNYYEAFQGLDAKLHPLSQVMIRNRKREVLAGEMVSRKAHKVEVRLTEEEMVFYHEVSLYISQSYAQFAKDNRVLGFVLTIFRKLLVSSPRTLAVSLEKRVDKIEMALKGNALMSNALSKDELDELGEIIESAENPDRLFNLLGSGSGADAREEIDRLRRLAARARGLKIDTKAAMLLEAVIPILESNPREKILIFTQFRETQRYLQELFEIRGHRVALFHSEQGSDSYSKRLEFERFKKSPDVNILISTEVGGEGLNLQFCHILFNYDLPWNPMRIEQRIGRLDRIGQTHDVHIYNFHLADTIDGRILDVLQDRIRLFEETIGNLDPILGDDIEDRIRDVLMADADSSGLELDKLEREAEKRLKDARNAERALTDFIMDRASFRRDTYDSLMGRVPPITHEAIERLIRGFFSRYPEPNPIRNESKKVCLIKVPERFRQECKKRNVDLDESYRGTFDPTIAIQEEAIDFFAFGHPVIDAVVNYCKDYEEHGHLRAETALRVVRDTNYRGYEGLQFNYILVFGGVRAYRKLIPVVLDYNGKYDESLSGVLFHADSIDPGERQLNETLDPRLVATLCEQSESLIWQIAEKELVGFKERNASNLKDLIVKTARSFDYRIRNQTEELERRKERLEEAIREQYRTIRAWEGQVKTTETRLDELAKQRDQELARLEASGEAKISEIKLLSVARVLVI